MKYLAFIYVLEHETSNAFTYLRVSFGCHDGKGVLMMKVVTVNLLIQNFCSKVFDKKASGTFHKVLST